MNIEQQVCSLELSKRLHELGVKQESLFYYWIRKLTIQEQEFTNNTHKSEISYGVQFTKNSEGYEHYSAFTASELLELLPKYSYEIINSFRFIEVNCKYLHLSFKHNNLCDALSSILIYLIENGLYDTKCITELFGFFS